MTTRAIPVVLLLAGVGCAGPPRYAASAAVRVSAQRAVVVGVVRCEALWQRRPLEGVQVQLLVDGEATPVATGTSGPDGVFALASGFVPDPDRPAHLHIAGLGWSGEARLVAALDQTYSVAVSALCPATRPRGLAMLDAVVTLQALSTAAMETEYPRLGGHRDYWDFELDSAGR